MMVPNAVYIAGVQLDAFKPYLEDLIKILLEWEEKAFNDERGCALDLAWARLAAVMEESFKPYFLKIVHRVIATARIPITTLNHDNDDSDNFVLLEDGFGYVSKTDVDRRKKVLDMLFLFTGIFVNEMAPMLETVYEIANRSFEFPGEELRKAGLSLMLEVTSTLRQIHGKTHIRLMYMFDEIFPKLIEKASKIDDDVYTSSLRTVSKVICYNTDRY